MKILSKFKKAVTGWLGVHDLEKISARKQADSRDILQKLSEELSAKGYNGKPPAIDNINQVFLSPGNHEFLGIETNLRYKGGAYIHVNIDFLPGIKNFKKLNRAVSALGFNLVSTLGDRPDFIGLNPRNYADITKVKEWNCRGQMIFELEAEPRFPEKYLIVHADHEWLSRKAPEIHPVAAQPADAVEMAP